MTCHCSDPITVPRIFSQNPIYPFTVNPCPRTGCSFTIPPMHCFVFPFNLCPEAIVQIAITHTAPVQDRSLRAWVSYVPIGMSVTLLPYNVSFWEPNRTGRQTVTVFDSSLPPPCGITTMISATPGVYYLNVHNLVNSCNEFSVSLTQCGCDDTP